MFANASFVSQAVTTSDQSQSTLMMGMGEAKKPRTEEKQTCLPVTVRSIEAAIRKRTGDDEVQFFGAEPGMLVILGVVESVVQQATSIELVINDSTGRLRLRQYSAEPDSPLTKVEAGRYIMAAGMLRTSPETHLTVTTARIVESPDEISYHMIEAAHAALRLQKGEVAPASAMQVDVGVVASPMKTFGAAPAAAAPAAAPVAAAVNTKSVTDVLRQEGDGKTEGVSVATIVAKLAPAPESEVRKLLQKLEDDGEIYTTLDDQHFALL